ncbi:hypothetical protein FKM82_014712 [Ascaphus truei]
MSDKEMLEDDIWEYKSIRKTKQSDKPAEINAAKKEQTKAVKPKRRGVRRAGSVASAKNTKRSQVPNGNIAQPSPTRDQNKRKQIPQADATTPTKKHTVNKKQSPRTPQPKHDGHCPSCQMPFSILLVQTPRWHASECLDTPGCNEKGNENTSSQTFTCAANQPESHFKAVSINEGLDWLECNSPESVADCWFSDDLDYKFTSSAQGKEETFSVPSNEISNCMKSKERDFGTNSQRCERQLPKYKSSFSSLQTVVGEEEGLTFTQRTSTMPSKRQPSVPAVNAVTSKGMKQMDIGVFFGLKPKAKVEKDDVKLSLKSQSEVGPVGGKKPGKRKADGSVGDTESFADINKIPAGAVSGSQQRWRKKFRQSSTGEEGKGRKQCPFYKKMPGTGFTVDAFQYGEIEGCSAYFLTHFHSDHYGGLTKKFRFPIYCSKITGNLVQSKLRVEKEFINTLPMYTECVVNNITVVLLDANHCPGAVLFLFCLPNGTRILHTGDFRADHSMEKYSALIGQKIHSLYLDTTYCSPEYTFPPQQEAIQFAVNSAFEMVTLYPRTLVVCGTYSVGKEKVFLAIAHILGCKVSMSPDKCKTMQCLESEEIRSLVTTDWHSTALHVLPMMQVNFKGLLNHLNKFSGKYDRVLAFKPTGWTYSDRCDSVADIKPQAFHTANTAVTRR